MPLVHNLLNVQCGIKARILAVRVHSIAMTKELVVTILHLAIGVLLCVQWHVFTNGLSTWVSVYELKRSVLFWNLYLGLF